MRVLIADDHPLILAGIRRTLEGLDDIEVVGEAGSANEVIRLVERRAPGLVLMDLRMPGVSGAECVAEVRERWPDVKVVVLSACEDRPSIEGALAAGAHAYVVKSTAAIDIPAVLRQACNGAVFYASAPASTGGDTADGVLPQPVAPVLTAREASILTAIARGLTTSAISKDLWVSEHTIKFHLTNIYRKLGVSNRAGAIRYAMDHGMVSV
jgi:DNA-binding NarL/FixJ family response regulator